jgi:hypothetical protein
MSKDTAGSRPPQEEALAEEIERTREHLGETVEALAAKADVKGRAQRRAGEAKDNLLGKARAAKDKVTGQAGELRGEAAASAAKAKGAAQGAIVPVREQVTTRAVGAARAIRGATPAPVQRSAGQAVVIVRGHREKAAAATTVAAILILAWLVMSRRRS